MAAARRAAQLAGELHAQVEELARENAELRRRLSRYEAVPDRLWDAPVSSTLSSSSSPPAAAAAASSSPLSPRVLRVRGHADGVWDVDACASRPWLGASAGADGAALVWRLDGRGGPLLAYRGHRGSVNSARFHPSSRLLLTASGDGTAHAVRFGGGGGSGAGASTAAARGEVAARARACGAPLAAAAWVGGGRHFCTGAWDGAVRVYAVREGGGEAAELAALRGHTAAVSDVRAHPRGARVLSASRDGTFRVWDARAARAVLTGRHAEAGRAAAVSTAAFGAAEHSAVTASDDGQVLAWDLRSPAAPAAAAEGLAAPANRLAVSPLGEVALPCDDGEVRVWDGVSGPCRAVGGGRGGGGAGLPGMTAATACAWSACGTRLLAGGWAREVRVWSA